MIGFISQQGSLKEEHGLFGFVRAKQKGDHDE
jgi:hypothetical protein